MTAPAPPEDRTHSLPAVFARGLAMGAADIVPGVSGGTIAFITGIYFRLLNAINSVPGAFWQRLCRGKLRAFWQATDASFLTTLIAGILFSVVTLASAITYALDEYPIPLWSFFFGLITASVWHVAREIRQRRLLLLIAVLTGAAVAWWVTTLSPLETAPTNLVLFGGGALAICAMILPGISGSFILVIMGLYAPVLDAVKQLDVVKLMVFGAGCGVGLLSIARLLTWAVNRFHDWVLAFLTGVMIGALNKVWPWKETVSWRLGSAGQQVPVQEINVSPQSYAELTGSSPELMQGVLAALGGLFLVLLVEWAAARFNHSSASGAK
ncbi:DUF368 domain-containing protein [Marinobacter sp.]|uniref:DUF368 domain-containing protein n=1 Tax=Marinobacter sp. TaxID=50741 RepID=UPI00384D6B49